MQNFRASGFVRGLSIAGWVALTAALVACGGGGGSGEVTGSVAPAPAASAPTPVAAWPSSGTYSPILKFDGRTNATPLTVALSLAHPASPTVEYVLDAAAVPNTVGQFLEQGTFNAATQKVTGLTTVAYLDSPNGLLRSTALTANGARPVQATGNVLASCSAVGGLSANNYTTPYASQVVFSTPGTDGVCGTADDAEALVTFSPTGVPSASAMPTGTSLGYLRSTLTGLPSYLFRGFPDGSAQAFPVPATNAAIINIAPPVQADLPRVVYKKVQNFSDIILYTRNGQLMALNGRTSVPAAAMLSPLTGPEGWRSAGYDSNNVYAYLNSNIATSGTGNYRILAISRSTLAISTLAEGLGAVQDASISGGTVLFATVRSGGRYLVLRTPTNGSLGSAYLNSSSTASIVGTYSTGRHILINSNASGTVSSQIINDAGTVLYTAAASAPFGLDSNVRDAVTDTVSDASFLFIGPLTATAYGGALITRFDDMTLAARTIGTVPTRNSLGGTASQAVFVGPLTPNLGFGGIHAVRVFSSTFQPIGSAVYTYNTGVTNSLTLTTSQVK